MASPLVQGISIDEAKIWTGGHRLVYALGSQAMPTKIEDVIDTSTMALKTGWIDFGPTSDDGFEITREGDREEGISIDQRDYNLGAGGLNNVTMGGSCTLMYSDTNTLKIKWEFGTITDIPAVAGPTGNAHQQKLALGNPATPTARRLVIFQQNKNGMTRMFVFRKAVVELGGSLTLKKGNPEGTEVSFIFEPDASVVDGTDFGLYFEQLPV